MFKSKLILALVALMIVSGGFTQAAFVSDEEYYRALEDSVKTARQEERKDWEQAQLFQAMKASLASVKKNQHAKPKKQDEEKKHDDHVNAAVEPKSCVICSEDETEKHFTWLPCKHAFCSDCLLGVVDTGLKEKNLDSVRCPDVKCKKAIPEAVIRNIASKAQLDAYLELALNQWMSSEKNIKHCPTPNCTVAFIKPGARKLVNCEKCHELYCSDCLIFHEKEKTCQQAAAELKGDDAQTKQLLAQTTVPCPGCRAPIEKSEGCNHMTCRKCNHQFCWICLNPYGPAHGGGVHNCPPGTPLRRPAYVGAAAAAAPAPVVAADPFGAFEPMPAYDFLEVEPVRGPNYLQNRDALAVLERLQGLFASYQAR